MSDGDVDSKESDILDSKLCDDRGEHIFPEPAEIVREREGDVLLKNTILKSDHFPGCQNTSLLPLLEGAPNFRKVEGLSVFGVAVPTVDGLRVVLEQIRKTTDREPVLWTNLREEPLIYINGNPFVVREKDNPFANLEYTGIDVNRVEDMEERLKADVLAEARKYNDHILVSDENDDFQVIDKWLPVTHKDVQTPKELYLELKEEGFDIVYTRIPITDEKAPKESDFDLLVQRLWRASDKASVVFNCQMGRGRTTTGMIIATLLILRRTQAFPPLPTDAAADAPTWFAAGIQRSLLSQASAMANSDATAVMKAGYFLVVRSMLRVLEHGAPAKAVLDAVIDACSSMQNLRTAIATYRGRLIRESTESKRSAMLHLCQEYIERYCALLAFVSYLFSKAFCPGQPGHRRYSEWMAARPEIKSVWDRLLRSFPLLSLELDDESGQSKLSHTSLASRQQGFEELSEMLSKRNGAVLGPSTILKADNYPSLYSRNMKQAFEGAPNFRQAPGCAVYGVGISTIGGIKAVLEFVKAGPIDAAAPSPDTPSPPVSSALWHNLREEPVLYINGTPYVLREAAGPYKNMKEYSGIRAQRLEEMEARLKLDVLEEARRLGGKVLVLNEFGGGEDGKGRLEHGHEVIQSDAAVQTPLEVYETLASQGYRVNYRRIAMTDGQCPGMDDVDTLHASISSAPENTSFIFSCQQGKGRTTVCMVMAMANCNRQNVEAMLQQRGLSAQLSSGASMRPTPSSLSLPSVQGGLTRSGQLASELTNSIQLSGSARNNSVHQGLPAIPDEPVTPTAHTLPTRASSDIEGQSEGDSDVDCSPPPASILTPAPRLQASASRRPNTLRRSCVRLTSKAGSAYDDIGDFAVNGASSSGLAGLAGSHQGDLPMDEDSAKDELLVALRQGKYMGVRRLVRQLFGGDSTAKWVDMLIDSCSHMVNLRTVIARYRLPRRALSQWQPEMSKLRMAFARGSVSLARYCLLIAYGSYVERCKDSVPFSEWIESMPSVQEALSAPLTNPMDALAPIPATTLSLVTDENTDDSSSAVSNAVVSRVLGRRRFRMLTPHTILKSFHMPGVVGPTSQEVDALDGVSDLVQVSELPIWITPNPSVQGTRNLLTKLGAGPEGDSTVVIIDVREDLSIYLRGHPYTRRELEFPAASMHHAGIHWKQMQAMERWLLEDAKLDSMQWGSRILLHRELMASDPPNTDVSCERHATHQDGDDRDVTKHETRAIAFAAFWCPIDAGSPENVDTGLATPLQVGQALQQEGFRLLYRRVPLARNRTPVPHDLHVLHEAACAGGAQPNVKFLVLVRHPCTTSSRLVATFLASMILAQREAAEGTESVDIDSPHGQSPSKRARTTGAGSENKGIMNLCRVLPAGIVWKSKVDAAMERCKEIGTIATDIRLCLQKVRDLQAASKSMDKETDVSKMLERAAARRLGSHYLMRYFLLIAFRGYLHLWLEAVKEHREGEMPRFDAWFDERKELYHLLNTLQID